MSIKIVGLGPGDISQISYKAMEAIKMNKNLYLRTEKHPIIENLDIKYTSFDYFYEENDKFEQVYEKIANKVCELGENQDIVYAVPGHPRVAESTVPIIESICNEKSIDYEIIPSMSFVDAMFGYIGFDPSEGFRLLDAFKIDRKNLDNESNIIITQVYDRFIASNVKLKLMEYYEDDQDIMIVSSAGISGSERKKNVKLYCMDRNDSDFDNLTSIYIPKNSSKKFNDIFDIMKVVKILRSDSGCPWDKKQTHESLKKYIIEEAYEVVETIDNDDIDGLIDELGDVLYNILIHCEIGEEEGYFDFYEVCDSITKKMIHRHPKVFIKGYTTYESDLELWKRLKLEEEKNKIDKKH